MKINSYVIGLLFFSSCLAASQSFEDDYKKGIVSWQKGYIGKENLADGENLQDAFAKIKKAAISGNSKAQYDLATMYREGIGTKKDLSEYKNWCEQASKNGFYLANNELGVIYEFGLGIDKNIDTAIEYYTKAMNCGCVVALKNLERILGEEEEEPAKPSTPPKTEEKEFNTDEKSQSSTAESIKSEMLEWHKQEIEKAEILKTVDIAKNLLREGVSVEIIANCTKLSLEKIKEIKETLN